MPDFSLLTMPNFAQAALSGYKAGAAQGQSDRLDSALSGIDLEKPETLLPVLRADPSTGAALIGASTQLANARHQRESQAATAAYVKAISSPPPATPAATPAAPASTPGSTTPSDPSQDVVVTAPSAQAPAPNVTDLRNAAIDADPTGFLDIQGKIATMNKAQRDALDDASQTFASVGQTALTLPYEQRKAYIQAHASVLVAHGVPSAQIAAFDPTDQNIHTEVGQAIGVKGQLDQANKAAEMAQTQHHQGVEEAQGAQRIGLEGQNVGIAAGHLALARNADARAAKADAQKTPPGAPVRYQYRTVNGVVQKRAIP